ncbi:alpha/beta hydrolase [Paraburkholderia azotifigens]|uniref:alpha/beta hydrolase n=1 Tax=Paraburkholderia azotifigens TaxID=2057004 RepID=UPI003B8A7BBE
MVQRLNVEIEAEGGIKLRAWLFMPDARKGLLSAISMAHGYAGTREHGLERFAHAFASAGFIVLLHDHRGFGSSEGEPRHDVDPWRQIADWRRAISFLESCEGVDPARIGLWGTSFAGGHAIVLGATDRRLRCVVAQVPTLSGYEQGLRRIPPNRSARWRKHLRTMSVLKRMESRRCDRPSSVTIRTCRPLIARWTRWTSTFSPSPKGCGRTPSRCAQSGWRGCTSRAYGYPGSRQRRF